ncbi:MAG: Fur family transcriptional regulator [Dehalococcoidia bacterium]
MTTQTKPNLIEVLEDLGCRVTEPRRRMIELLERRQDSFGVEDLLTDLPDVGRATVYRTIKLLLEAGALCKSSLPDGSPRYTVDESRHHHHVVCVQCGRVEEFRHSSVERMLRSMRGEIPGELVGHRLELYMLCDQCALQSQD